MSCPGMAPAALRMITVAGLIAVVVGYPCIPAPGSCLVSGYGRMVAIADGLCSRCLPAGRLIGMLPVLGERHGERHRHDGAQ